MVKKRYDDIYEEISKNIRKYRKKINMTQKELAEKSGYCHQYIRRIASKKSKKHFSIDTVYVLSRTLGVSITDLITAYKEED